MLLNDTAEQIRQPFVAMIGTLGKGHEQSMDWWVSEIASRNTNTNSLYQDSCMAIFLRKMVDLHPEGVEVTTDSWPLCQVVRQNRSQWSGKIRISCTLRWPSRLKQGAWGLAVQLKSQLQLCFQYFVSRLVFPSRVTAWPSHLTLVDTFVDEFSFKNGNFVDRFYKKFGAHLDEEEWQHIYYWPTYTGRWRGVIPCFRALRQSTDRFILKQDFLKIRDYIYAFFYPVRALMNFPQRFTLEGVDVTPLLRGVWWSHLFSATSIEGLLNYSFARRLKEKGVSLRLIIDWFENQIVDKGANAGFRRFFPNTLLIGYQGILVPKHFLCMFPTREEAENAILPHVVAVCGKGLQEGRREFYSGLSVVTAPAFRFSGAWRERRNWPETTSLTVLVVLPLEEGWVDVLKTASAVSSSAVPAGTRFWLKTHPAAGPLRQLLRRGGLSLPASFELVEGEFEDLVERSDVVIGNMSSACVEAMAKGVPVIVVSGHTGLIQNPIPDFIGPDLWRLCEKTDDVREALFFFSHQKINHPSGFLAAAAAVREVCFEPVTRETVRRFLRLNSPGFPGERGPFLDIVPPKKFCSGEGK